MESISIIKVATNLKKEAKKFRDKKVLFCTNTTCFYSVQCKITVLFWAEEQIIIGKILHY